MYSTFTNTLSNQKLYLLTNLLVKSNVYSFVYFCDAEAPCSKWVEFTINI